MEVIMQQMQDHCGASHDDAELLCRVTSYLATKHLPTLAQLNVNAVGGTVTLRGRVDSFHEKQVAIHSCRRVAGVRELVDEMEVREH
jgi:osmotically-inducible protein OsmY